MATRPEVAATMPAVSPDGRTYSFTVRRGYRFSPPSNQPVTAETFRYSIERALSPRLAQNPTGQTPPAPQYIDDIEGERAFRSGTAEHISGLRASGDTLSITLRHPSPDFLGRLALPFFCPVPRGTPFVAGAPTQGDRGRGGHIVSAGPYYVANYTNEEYVILKRNPNYQGPRSHSLDGIVILEGVGASIALDWIEQRRLDGITSLSDPLLDLGGVVDRRWGAGSAAAARGDQRYFASPLPRTRFVAFNAGRGIFADPGYAVPPPWRSSGGPWPRPGARSPRTRSCPQGCPGTKTAASTRYGPRRAKARVLMHGDGGRAVMAVRSGCDPCSEAAHVVQSNLAAIGIDVEIRRVESTARLFDAAATFDLVDAETGIPYPDSASFLSQLLEDIPSGWVAAGARAKIHRVAGLSGSGRQTAAAALADRLTTNEAPVAAYATPHVGQFIGPRIGCRAFTPFGYGLDLAALCVRESSR
jgi:ABC-type oligopeptide transport system substrate-binding subunit